MTIALAEALRHITDPNFMLASPSDFLNRDYLAKRAREIRMDRAVHPVATIPADHGTVYLSAADKSGMMVSFIQSNYMGFGSGIVIPGS